jgi:hypothetical protein
MSIGNLKDNGNKGNNFPYQLAVLKLLDQIAINIGSGGLPVVRNPSMIRTSTNGTVSAGVKSVSFYNTGATSATVLGTVLKAGEQVTYSVENPDTLAAFPYDATGTELLITTIV